jgi:hypothetical protein
MVASARRLPAPRTFSSFNDWVITPQSSITMHHEQKFDTNGLCDILFKAKNEDCRESTPLLLSSDRLPIVSI